jgi:hypothetical protein
MNFNGNPGCFHNLAIVKSAAINKFMLNASSDSYGYMLKNGLAGSYGSSIFRGISRPIFIAIKLVYIPANNV